MSITLHTVFRTPFNSLGHSDFFQLHNLGGPKAASFNVDSAAALFCTAARTVTCLTAWKEQMRVAAEEHLGVSFGAAGGFHHNCRDSPPFAQNLKQAFEGFTSQWKVFQYHRLTMDTSGSCLNLEVTFSHDPGRYTKC